jgi:membrane protease YdiL (CAAX protease family)
MPGPHDNSTSTPVPVAQEGSSSSPARWLRPVAVRLVAFVVLFAGLDVAAAAINGAADSVPVLGLFVGLLIAWLAVLLYRWAVRKVERREVVELAPEAAAGGLRRGALLGLGLFAVTIAVIAVFGGYHVLGGGSFGGALDLFGMMAAVAVIEEMLLRGVVFRLVEEFAGTWGALVVSAVVFGGLHLINPEGTLWGAVAIAIEAGLMLGAAYAATRSLWLPIGLHFGWNLAESAIFGTTVSGSDQSATGLLRGVLTGPAALTGGTFGPEASVLAILVCGVPTVLFLRAARRRGHIQPRRSRAVAPERASS